MAFFKSFEEKLTEAENKILTEKEYIGQVGARNTGYSFSEGFRNADKIRFKKTKFKIYDDRIMIERHRTFINFSEIKEIFQEIDKEAIIILNNNDIIPIAGMHNIESERIELKAFINILNKLIKKNKANNNNKITRNPEDKFDKLIKLGEMYDKGLLSDDEFASLKQELLSGNNKDSPVINENVETSRTTCKNCGAEISSNDSFCGECGTKIKK